MSEEYPGIERRAEATCAGADCPQMIRLKGAQRSNKILIRWVVGFFVATFASQGVNFVIMANYKESHALANSVENSKINNIARTATEARDAWQSHDGEKNPQRAQVVHGQLRQLIKENEYNIKLNHR